MTEHQSLVQRLEAEWREALFAKDEARLRSLIHPDFQLVAVRAEQPVALDLDGWISALSQMDLADMQVEIGHCVRVENTIVATVDARWTVKCLGQLVEERVLLTDVWVQCQEGWRVIRRHSSPLPSDPVEPEVEEEA
ncbi:nuclear transport factor 2 family protein [Sphingomicrobium sediminis]|uniref:Nuclear transport factor 2 family protein n=1 Tax=Sphingomicrobium sediminis TaxID=2950949 RepID=A0A9X2EGK4_9SPHN|nr:nuclear transport factor 2 family protein [Sphingomicrobium sediminis]MCM8557638.1 nuclear transport factor 2 family protein [Sphingomicrobium sediminis]